MLTYLAPEFWRLKNMQKPQSFVIIYYFSHIWLPFIKNWTFPLCLCKKSLPEYKDNEYSSLLTMTGFNNWHLFYMYKCLLLLAYALFFKVFKIFLDLLFWFWFFKTLMLYIPLIDVFVLERDICFKETLFFNFSLKISNNYFSLPQSTFP